MQIYNKFILYESLLYKKLTYRYKISEKQVGFHST